MRTAADFWKSKTTLWGLFGMIAFAGTAWTTYQADPARNVTAAVLAGAAAFYAVLKVFERDSLVKSNLQAGQVAGGITELAVNEMKEQLTAKLEELKPPVAAVPAPPANEPVIGKLVAVAEDRATVRLAEPSGTPGYRLVPPAEWAAFLAWKQQQEQQQPKGAPPALERQPAQPWADRGPYDAVEGDVL